VLAPTARAAADGKHGSGTFTATVSSVKKTITWHMTYRGLTGRVIAAHIHIGGRLSNGDVLLPLCTPCRSPAHGSAAYLQPSTLGLLAGKNTVYVNVHTNRYSEGEIRGELHIAP